jgi:hypothetical protein
MKKQIIFTGEDVGCYADGCNGQAHIRTTLADYIEQIMPEGSDPELLNSLRSDDYPDDFSDEEDAIDILQSVTADGLCWVMESGDLLLVAEDQLDS